MIAEIRLVSNDGESSAAFWSAIFNVPAEALGQGHWRISPATGPDIVVSTTPIWQAITRCDLTVAVDPDAADAADRLRALGFEVALDSGQAVDVNGTDSTVFLVVRRAGTGTLTWTGMNRMTRRRSRSRNCSTSRKSTPR